MMGGVEEEGIRMVGERGQEGGGGGPDDRRQRVGIEERAEGET